MEVPGQCNYGGIFGVSAGDGSGDCGPAPPPTKKRWLVPKKKGPTTFEKGSAARKPNMMLPYTGEFQAYECTNRIPPAGLYG